MNVRRAFGELKRRRVFRVAGLYIVAAWAIIQVASTVFPILAFPAWTVRLVFVLVLLGFPLSLALAWAFDLDITPDPAPGLAAPEPTGRMAPAGGVKTTHRPMRTMAVALVAALVSAAVWVAWSRSAGAPARVASERVAVFPFDVRAGRDAQYLRDGMVSLLAARLDGAGGLKSTDPQALLRAVPGAAPDGAEAARLASHFGAGYYVLGSVVGGGRQIEIAASLYRIGGGNRPEATARAVGPADSVFELVDRVAIQLLSIHERGTPAVRTAALTTSSLPAFKAYLEGERSLRDLHTGAAVDAFSRAVSIDTTFALAYSRLATSALWDGNLDLVATASVAAERRSDRLPPRFREMLAADAALFRNDPDVEYRYRGIVARSPEDAEAWYKLGEVLFHRSRNRQRSRTEARGPFERALALDPGNELYLVHLRELACIEDRPSDLRGLAPQTGMRDPRDPLVNGSLVALSGPARERDLELARLAAVDDAEFSRTVQFASLCSPPEALSALFQLADGRPGATGPDLSRYELDLVRGRRAAAHEEFAIRISNPIADVIDRSCDFVRPLVPPERHELESAHEAVLGLGNLLALESDSVRVLDALLQQYCLGRIELSLGRQREAANRAATLRASPGSPRTRNLATLLSARLNVYSLAAAGRRDDAFRAFEDLDALGLVGEINPRAVMAGDDDERWLRAELLREAGRDGEALEWYRSLTEAWVRAWYRAPAELRIAQLAERRGDKAAALRGYRRFVALWHDADPPFQPLVRSSEARIRSLAG